MTTRSILAAAAAAAALLVAPAHAQYSYVNGTISESFDSLTISTNSTTFGPSNGTQVALPGLPVWVGTKIGGNGGTNNTSTTLVLSNGSSSSGGLFSFGALNSTERALGMIASGSNIMAIGTEVVNNSGGRITGVTISFRSEFWRNSTVANNTMVFAHGTNSGAVNSTNFLSAAGMTNFPSLNIVGPPFVGSNGQLDGNNPLNQANVSATITGLNIANGSSIFLRWQDANDAGNDAGLALDDFNFTATVSFGSDINQGAGNEFTPVSFTGAPFTSNDTAVFNGAATTVSLNGTVVATGLKFPNPGYTLAGLPGSSLHVTSAITADSPATISGDLVGSSGLTKLGNGTLTLSGNNTFTGTVNMVAGGLSISSDANLGDAANDVSLNGSLSVPASFALGAGRDLSTSGNSTVVLAAPSVLTLNGNLTGTFSFVNATGVTFAGATNAPGTLTFPSAVSLNITGGALAPTGGLVLNQTSGTTTVTGPLLASGGGDRTLAVAGGTFLPTGSFGIGTGRWIKTGDGILDLTSTTLTTANATSGGLRIGVQGTNATHGGTVIVDEATDLGASQLQFNSGTLQINAPITTASGLSIGGRWSSPVPTATFNGSAVTFNGNSSFFTPSGSSGDLGLIVNTAVTLAGNLTRTTNPNAGLPNPPAVWVDLSGSGSLTISGNASTWLDRFDVNGGATLALNGSLGGERILVRPGSKFVGAGTYSGYFVSFNNTTYFNPSSLDVQGGGTVELTGLLTVQASVDLQSGSSLKLDINGTSRGTSYDALDVGILVGGPATSLSQNSDLTLTFGSPATAGTYNLIGAAPGVTRSGTFSAVTLAGAHSGPMSLSGSTWTATDGPRTFSFDSSTGDLVVTGGVSAPEITSPLAASATTGLPFFYQIVATNSPTSYSFSPLPAGLIADMVNGTISGSPFGSGVFNVTISATNAGGTDTETLVLTITPPAPVITSPSAASATVGSAFSYTITGSNSPTSFGVVSLPAGLALNSSTGEISGIPTVPGVFPVDISATNAGGTGNGTVTITITTPLQNWRQAFFGTTANSGTAADSFDADGDNIPNLVEYGLGTNPIIANASPVVVSQVGSFLRMTFPRINDPALTYTVWATNSMSVAPTSTGTSFPGVAGLATYDDGVNVSAAGAQRYLHLRVTY